MHLYCEKMTGIKADRPELNRQIDDLEAGDTVIIADLTRISRSTVNCIVKNHGSRAKIAMI